MDIPSSKFWAADLRSCRKPPPQTDSPSLDKVRQGKLKKYAYFESTCCRHHSIRPREVGYKIGATLA